MTAILTAAEMRALEQAAIARGEVTGLDLMERAGRGVVEAILAEWPEIEQGARRAVVLCGPGNNGGDGFVVARLLQSRGWKVTAFLYGDAARVPPDAKTNLDRWRVLGEVRRLEAGWMETVSRPELLVDALFGTGLARPLAPDLVDALHPLLAFRPPWGEDSKRGAGPLRTVAIDVPSGICADSGRMLAPPDAFEPEPDGAEGTWPRFMAHAIQSHLTVTFHNAKLGHYLSTGPTYGGKLRTVPLPGLPLVDVGTPPTAEGTDRVRLMEPVFLGRSMSPRTAFRDLSKAHGHKYSHGHALLLSGGCGKGGAARLAARGALRIGAGLVTLAIPPAALQENAARLDAIMLRSVRDAEALTALLQDSRLNALAAGPGLGTSDREAALLSALLDTSRETTEDAPPRALVLDADALTLLANDPALRAKLHDRVVLTPHEGEFARLFPGLSEKLKGPATTGPAYSKVDAARDAARECGAVVLLKGPDTVIAEPSGRAAINAAVYDRAAPWLATAGSGDVLAGFIAGLLARGFQPFDAACTAAWLHVECARSFGPGLIAEDLPEELPKVFRSLGL